MANRNLVTVTDALLDEEGIPQGWHSVLRIERSASGQPGLQFIIEDWDGGMKVGETSLMVENGWSLLAPVLAWLSNRGDEPRERLIAPTHLRAVD